MGVTWMLTMNFFVMPPWVSSGSCLFYLQLWVVDHFPAVTFTLRLEKSIWYQIIMQLIWALLLASVWDVW